MTTKKKAALKRTRPRGATVKRPVGRRAQNKEAIRKRIVAAALGLFQTKGFDAAFIHALKPASPLGIFSHRAQELRHRYVGFVQELLGESLPKNQYSPLSFLAPEVFWI